MNRVRLDHELVRRGLARSRARAQELVHAGAVAVAGKPARKPSEPVTEEVSLELKESDHPMVGRGGLKLDAALETLDISVEGDVVLDVGSSTGGFVDCLLRRGARLVQAIDVGTDALAPELREDPRVRWREGTDARELDPRELDPSPDFITVDCSFISLTLLLPSLVRLAPPARGMLVLVKPQFELGPGAVDGRGVVRSADAQMKALTVVFAAAKDRDLSVRECLLSSVPGRKGNREWFVWLEPGGGEPNHG